MAIELFNQAEPRGDDLGGVILLSRELRVESHELSAALDS